MVAADWHKCLLSLAYCQMAGFVICLVTMSDRQTIDAGAPELEITPEMIEAGLRAYWESGAAEIPNASADRELIRRIYLAMSHVRF